MLETNSRLIALLRSELWISSTMALVALPWILVVLFTAGFFAALNFCVYAFVVLGVGYSIVSLAFPSSARSQTIVVAPAVGILVISSLTAFWVRMGLPIVWAPAFWFALSAVGALLLCFDRAQWTKGKVAYGWTLVVLSVLICAIFFLPGARNDAVLRSDGSFNWIYPDTQYNGSMAVAIKSGGSPPKEPGTVTAELLYHFGPYSPAAAISRLDGIELGDAYARVTRGASLWALVLSCFGLGTLLSVKANGGRFGGIMAVVGLFFYGSLTALFTDERNSASFVTGAILFKVPGVGVRSDGGPFSHLILGHSMLHALGAITAVIALCLIQRDLGEFLTRQELILVAFPALTVPVHSVGALYSLGAVCILLFWGRLTAVRSWLLILLMFCLFVGAWKLMGYGHAPDAVQATIKTDLDWHWQWGVLLIWFLGGLGIRTLGLCWISKPWKDPLSALVLGSALGLLLFFLLVQFPHGEEIYGLIYLPCLFSIFAFSRLTAGFWRGVERSQLIVEWLKIARWGLILFIAWAALLRVIILAVHSQVAQPSLRLQVLPCLVLLLLLVGLSILMKRSRRSSEIGSAILMGVLLIGFLGWIPAWLNYGMGRMKMDVTVSPGEVRGLKRLDDLMRPGERFATNKHAVESVATNPDRSHAYAALSERPVLLEGLFYHTQPSSQMFQTLVHDNDLMFSTTDPETLRDIAKAWQVRWLVARPGTDISVPRPLPPWLIEQPDTGTLKIYQID